MKVEYLTLAKDRYNLPVYGLKITRTEFRKKYEEDRETFYETFKFISNSFTSCYRFFYRWRDEDIDEIYGKLKSTTNKGILLIVDEEDDNKFYIDYIK